MGLYSQEYALTIRSNRPARTIAFELRGCIEYVTDWRLTDDFGAWRFRAFGWAPARGNYSLEVSRQTPTSVRFEVIAARELL